MENREIQTTICKIGKVMAEVAIFAAAIRADEQSALLIDATVGERVAILYELHREKIYRFLASQGLDAATAQELAQDVFVRLFVAISKGTEIQSENAWLYGVASKLAVDYWRREGRAMWVELDSYPALTENLRSTGPTPESAIMRRERLRQVAKAMMLLPKNQRLGIQLRMQGLRYRAIAEIMDVSVSTVAEWLSLAVERLRSAANE